MTTTATEYLTGLEVSIRNGLAQLAQDLEALANLSGKYGVAKARFDERMRRRGLDWEHNASDLVMYLDLKEHEQILRYWYSKVEHFQNEIAAKAAAVQVMQAERAWRASLPAAIPQQSRPVN